MTCSLAFGFVRAGKGRSASGSAGFFGPEAARGPAVAGLGFAAGVLEPAVSKIKSLRFAIGDKVQCKTGAGWSKGTVVQLMWRGPGMPPGIVAPYQVELESGDLIYAPHDDDQLIRKQA